MMTEIEKKIIDYLREYQVSTTEVADCLGKDGVLQDVVPCTHGHYHAGLVKWVYAHDESNWSLHEQIQDIKPGYIVFVDTYNCSEKAIFGQLVCKYLLVHHQSEAIVVQGKLRDAAALINERWPIWCSGFTPVGCSNEKPGHVVDHGWKEEQLQKYDGSIMVCDDCGVVVIPKKQINEAFLERLHDVEEQEAIWFDRLDHYNESTFDIVCQKKYLEDKDYMLEKSVGRARRVGDSGK